MQMDSQEAMSTQVCPWWRAGMRSLVACKESTCLTTWMIFKCVCQQPAQGPNLNRRGHLLLACQSGPGALSFSVRTQTRHWGLSSWVSLCPGRGSGCGGDSVSAADATAGSLEGRRARTRPRQGPGALATEGRGASVCLPFQSTIASGLVHTWAGTLQAGRDQLTGRPLYPAHSPTAGTRLVRVP